MRKNLLIAAAILCLFSCTKEKPEPLPGRPVSEMIGTWSIYSFKSATAVDSLYVTVNDYPCLANNQLEFKQDSTYTFHYAGSDTCWITPPPVIGARTGSVVGARDWPSYTLQWGQNGTTVYLTATTGAPATISKSGGKIFLTRVTPVNGKAVPTLATSVYVKIN